jgi:pimeloyl-ACP methyl ester carboxylesterase
MARSMVRVCLSLFLAAIFVLRVDAAQLVTGTTPTGAFYAFAVPDDWNGDLIVYGHGIVDPAAPVALPTTQDGFGALKEALLQRGFAVAYSSYSENGYALKDASQRLHELAGLFKERVGRQPSRVYLMGHSLGATAVQMLAERFPGHYDGALAMCGFVGGGVPEVEYLGDVRVLFDAYFPGVLPGNVLTVPAPPAPFQPGQSLFNAVLNALQRGFFTPGVPTLAFATAAKLPFVSAEELVFGAMNAIGFNLRFTNDLLARTNGHSFYDNLDTSYPAAVDGMVGRFTAVPPALEYLERYYAPSGSISFPVMTLHSTRDPVVPLFHETKYATIAPGAWLVQRTVNSFGHCAINQQEALTAFDDLVRWVTEGHRPAGGDATIR